MSASTVKYGTCVLLSRGQVAYSMSHTPSWPSKFNILLSAYEGEGERGEGGRRGRKLRNRKEKNEESDFTLSCAG